MLQRNWLQLDRKLVDKTDLEFTVQGMQSELDLVSLSMWGAGVLVTTTYPAPFVITPDTGDMGIVVSDGIGFDTTGNLTAILPSSDGVALATPAVGDSTNPRWDLLVIEYAQVGDTPVPQPSNPLVNVDLNLHDDFVLRIIAGTPSATPAYPSYTGPGFILAGLQVPAGTTLATGITIDFSQRQYSRFGAAQQPVFVTEQPTGAINGTNVTFTLSQLPISPGSLQLFQDSRKLSISEYTVSGVTVTMAAAPVAGQDVWAHYVCNSPNTQNPVQAITEVPSGTVDGTNLKFGLSMQPLYQSAVDVFIDGQWQSPDLWALVSGAGASSYILFGSGNQPNPGQDVEATYWINSWPNEVGFSSALGITGAANKTGAGVGLFRNLIGGIINFKNLLAGANIEITDNGDGTVTLSATGGGGGSSAPEIHGSLGEPFEFDPTLGLTPTSALDQVWFLQTSMGQEDVTATTQIAPGTTVGQRLTLMGVDALNYYTFLGSAGSVMSGLSLNGNCNITSNQALLLIWNGSEWYEVSRRA